jgi:uncharacterized surface protein with fasciclin (FAS1) repeats
VWLLLLQLLLYQLNHLTKSQHAQSEHASLLLLLHLPLASPLPLLDHKYTILAPTNAAFERLATQQLGLTSVEQLLVPEQKEFLTAVSCSVRVC